jgi:murein DD-endopeptidase MepM/ murein hydrolase activator NlpD
MKRIAAPALAGILLTLTAGAGESPAKDDAVRLYFPTANHHLLDDEEQFYQATIEKRSFGGHYGFVRSIESGSNPHYFNIFHMGLDIRPVQRDANGEPLDPVLAAADGRVAYVNNDPSKSNYGRYVKLFHQFPGGEVCTTYGHLSRVTVSAGQSVKAGERLGIMGYTGPGINKERAHVHFEFGFRTLPDYAGWYDKYGVKMGLEGKNLHGEYNGMNYIGIDSAPILIATAKGRPLTMKQIFGNLHPVLRVRVPAGKDFFYWQKCWPWMVVGGLQQKQPRSWEIDCDRMGIPLKFTPSDVAVSGPELIWFDNSLTTQEAFTRGIVEKRNGQRVLAKTGLRWFSQLTYLGD